MKHIFRSKFIIACFLIQNFISAQTFVSDYHKSHSGEITFNKEVNQDIKTAKDFNSNFTSKEDITGYVFLKNTIENYELFDKTAPEKPIKSVEKKYHTKFFIDNEEQKFRINSTMTGTKEGLVAFPIKTLRPSGGNVDEQKVRNAINKLGTGDHKIRIEMWAGSFNEKTSKDPIAKGEFTVNKIAYIEKSVGKYSTILATKADAKIEQDAQKIVNEFSAAKGGKIKYSKSKIVDKDWSVHKNDIGITTHRTIVVAFYGLFPDNTCRVDYFVMQQASGNGKYGPLQYNSIETSYLLDCD